MEVLGYCAFFLSLMGFSFRSTSSVLQETDVVIESPVCFNIHTISSLSVPTGCMSLSIKLRDTAYSAVVRWARIGYTYLLNINPHCNTIDQTVLRKNSRFKIKIYRGEVIAFGGACLCLRQGFVTFIFTVSGRRLKH